MHQFAEGKLFTLALCCCVFFNYRLPARNVFSCRCMIAKYKLNAKFGPLGLCVSSLGDLILWSKFFKIEHYYWTLFTNVFSVIFDTFNASFQNKSINFSKKQTLTHPKPSNGCVSDIKNLNVTLSFSL